MTTIIKIKTNTIKALMLFSVMTVAFSCSNGQTNTPKADATSENTASLEKKAESITIKGTVKAITSGKDGYSADVQTDNEGIYAALVSISNVGGPQNYKTCAVGDEVSFKGISFVSSSTKRMTVEEIISIGTTDTQMLIEASSFRGVKVGDAIKNYNVDYVQKSKIKTGEGSFEAYEIKDFENNPAAYFLPDPNNKLLVGDITINTPKASTKEGLKVGDTFNDLLKFFPNVEVHGSESEGRTYATANNISYRLDAANFQYDIDKKKIKAATKITEIMINRK